MTEDNFLEKLWKDNVEVDIRVVLPPKLVGGDGRKLQSRQYIPLEFMRTALEAGIALDRTIEYMANQIIGAVEEEVERGSER